MKTKLLRKLRKKANNSFYIDVIESSHVRVMYRVVRRGIMDEWLGEYATIEKAEEMLDIFKRNFIEDKIEIMRFYNRKDYGKR